MEENDDFITKDCGHNGDILQTAVISRLDVNEVVTRKRETRWNIIQLVFCGFVILFVGMQASQRGPAFLDLQLISGTSVSQTSSYFTAFSFGFMVGALVAGFLYDRFVIKTPLICIPLTLSCFFVGLTPWCTSYIPMLLAHMISASQHSIAETAILADQFYLWRGESESACQFISLTYSLGGVLGPLYTEPFLVSKWNDTDNTPPDQDHERKSKTDNASQFMFNLLNYSSSSIPTTQTVHNIGLENNRTFSTYPPESKLYYAYMITGLFGLLTSIPFYILWCKKLTKPAHEVKQRKKAVEAEHNRLSLKAYVILTAIVCYFLFAYSMIEDSFVVFLSMFVVSHLSWTKSNGAMISSLYWGLGTLSKLIAIPLVRRVDVGIIVFTCCVGMVISMTGFALASHYQLDVLMWLSCSAVAIFQSPMFGGCMSWADTNILKIDGKATSASMVSSAIGAMSGPLILGATMDNISFMMFPYIELGHCVILMLHFIFMYCILKPYVTLKYGPVRQNDNFSHENEVGVVKEKSEETNGV